MKLVLRVVAFSLCLVATYSAASFTSKTPATCNPQLSAPMPTCPPSQPWCTMAVK